ncbi:hypothetical protein CERSUDRAFT_80729 [Gelatoporia subvermispora B]|uniref:Uncharacterized protein n=1 Tax=Ceriporiopsis subvermispora (strain B) TaxID=914234 RepID=M2RQD8_CERS8|nr:hypothetical protein CERSUDRAFT_80729 [Gelatoporia subvermispora B]
MDPNARRTYQSTEVLMVIYGVRLLSNARTEAEVNFLDPCHHSEKRLYDRELHYHSAITTDSLYVIKDMTA